MIHYFSTETQLFQLNRSENENHFNRLIHTVTFKQKLYYSTKSNVVRVNGLGDIPNQRKIHFPHFFPICNVVKILVYNRLWLFKYFKGSKRKHAYLQYNCFLIEIHLYK